MKKIQRKNKGFTLLELLLVIAAIGILAAIVLVAINPNRQIAQARNAERRAEINSIYKAIEQYLIDTGSYPSSITNSLQDICITGIEQVGGVTSCSNKADLRVLVPTYLSNIPSDPQGNSYGVALNINNNRALVYSRGELGQVISINNLVDVDAESYLSLLETADNQSLEPSVRYSITKFIVNLKNDGTWNNLQASNILAGARTLNGALIPLKGPAPTNFNFISSDYNRKTGLIGNSTQSKYLDSNLRASDTAAKFHMSAYMSTGLQSGSCAMGRTDSKNYHTWICGQGNGYANKAYPYFEPNPTNIVGFIGHSRDGSFQPINKRQSGVTTSNDPAATFQMDSGTFKIFARDNNANIGLFTNSRIAFYSIGGSVDIAMLDQRVTALINELNSIIQ